MSTMSNLVTFWRAISLMKRVQAFFILILMLLNSLAEILSIGAVVPFLYSINTPNLLYSNRFSYFFIKIFKLNTPDELIVFFISLFILMILVAATIRLTLQVLSAKYSFSLGSEISNKIYYSLLNNTYLDFISNTSGNIINIITVQIPLIVRGLVVPFFTFLTSFFLLLFFIVSAFIFHVEVFIYVLALFSLVYFAFYSFIRVAVKANGIINNTNSLNIVSIIQDTFGCIKDIILNDNKALYLSRFRVYDKSLKHAQLSTQIFNQAPRILIETFGLVGLVITAFFLSKKNGNLNDTLPFLGVLVFSCQRILPVLQQIYSSWVSIHTTLPTIKTILKVLPYKEDSKHIKKIPFKKIKLKKHILLRDIYFSYKKNSSLLKDINLKILKGDFVGILGKSGCGKSTLTDIIMGIHSPNSGFLEVDGEIITSKNIASWRRNVAHVPQNVFILNASYLENIAFGIPADKININLVIKSAKKAKIHDHINSLPKKYDEITGEGGNLLSGGQKQRIAIARAFYKKAQLLILDEATNALDKKTESEILKLIKSLGPAVTVIMISHNLESLKYCSCVYKVENEKIYKI